VPQDIPFEASETLDFTPDCFKDIEGAPSFVLRTGTSREKRFHARLNREEGVMYHSDIAIRREIENGLKALWEEEAFDKHMPIIRQYWDALDQFAAQYKLDDTLKWEYDPTVEAGVYELIEKVTSNWAPLRRMRADNADFGDMVIPLLAAVIVKSWKGLDTVRRLDRGYLTLDCAQAMLADLETFAEKHGIEPGIATSEMFIACSRRMNLIEEEAKNSESPSPSETVPSPSNETTTSDKDGTSPASASSSTTPENS
jgi:hypothetical protein